MLLVAPSIRLARAFGVDRASFAGMPRMPSCPGPGVMPLRATVRHTGPQNAHAQCAGSIEVQSTA